MTYTHGLSNKHPLYERWMGMHARCSNPQHASYHRYGGRGITVCERWRSFPHFITDFGCYWPGHGWEIHRRDNDGHYEPGNCVWLDARTHRSLPKSAEHRAKIGAAHKGRKKMTDEQYAAIGQARRAPLDEDWLREAREKYGMSIQVIAEISGCSKSSVHRAIQRWGLVEAVQPDWDERRLAQTLAEVYKEEEDA